MTAETEAAKLVELMLIGGGRAMTISEILDRLPYPVDVREVVEGLNSEYGSRGISIFEVQPEKFAVRTRPEASDLCRRLLPRAPRMSPAAMQTISVIAYFQPVTRSEIERVRGVALSKGTLDILIFLGWVRPGPRRATPGSPMTFVTTEKFLHQFSLNSLDDLPEIDRLREEGLLDPAAGLDMAPRRDPDSDD
ncbi:SMC-Scp complex subunit ScpB [Agrobacterium rubi]|nr:SMC-Scp complex subunit ScpB [Agrobacterium rubi]NTF24552.1 SMC-Scp complex subunit ScpB [Agrobacterium rubi]